MSALIRSSILEALLIAAALAVMCGGASAATEEGVEVIPTVSELVADGLAGSIIHGWQTTRLVKHDGVLYASGGVRNPQGGDFWGVSGLFFRREPDGSWTQVGTLPSNPYTMAIDPDGRLWSVAPSSYVTAQTYRMEHPLDFGSFKELYNGTCSYLGASVSPEGNFLLLHAESSDYQYGNPNAVIAAFYDAETDTWHTSRLETPEGRYGYEGIILRGRRALAVLNSSIADPKANPTPPHYNWRHVRLAVCEDLTKGEWVQRGLIMPEYGSTVLEDMMIGPDGEIYLLCQTRAGETWEEYSQNPWRQQIYRLHWDLSAEVYDLDVFVNPGRLVKDSRGRMFMLGRSPAGDDYRMWELHPEADFAVGRAYVIADTAKLQGYVCHTLHPERFGGEDGGDRIHLLNAEYMPEETARLWHVYFDIP